MKILHPLVCLLLLGVVWPAAAQLTIPLWSGPAPDALGNTDLDIPSITMYLPDAAKATGAGVIVCPGGSYSSLSTDKEGVQPALWLNKLGIAGFVLKYRLGPRYHHPIELHDAQRAIRMVRYSAAAMGVNPSRVGIWGFSAGGHLASTAATHYDLGDKNAADPIDRVGCRPDFVILAYPVITMQPPWVHVGSRTNLLGNNPLPELVQNLSNESQVTPDTPPAFLFHTNDDATVPTENSLLFYFACKQNKVPAELHVYQPGAHGVGLANTDPVLASWPSRLADWFYTRKLIPAPAAMTPQ